MDIFILILNPKLFPINVAINVIINPITLPIKVIKTVSARSSVITFPFAAPIALFMPISLVRSFTDIIITVIILKPATKSETAPMAESANVIILSRLFSLFLCYTRF